MTPSTLSEPLQLPLTQEDLDAINAHLKLLTPEVREGLLTDMYHIHQSKSGAFSILLDNGRILTSFQRGERLSWLTTPS